MKMFIAFALAAMLSLAFAAELDASVFAYSFQAREVDNCDLHDGPSMMPIEFRVNKPSALAASDPMNYDIYNFSTGQWQAMGKACSVGTYECKISAPVYFGGQGNGTVTHDVVKLYAGTGTVYEKTFSFTVHHVQGPTEVTILSKKSQSAVKLDQAKAINACTGTTCCKALQAKVTALQVNFDNIDSNLRICKSQNAYGNVTAIMNTIDPVLTEGTSCSNALGKYAEADAIVNKALPTNCKYYTMGLDKFNSATSKLASAKSKLESGNYDVAADLDGAKADAAEAQQKVTCNESTDTPGTGTGAGNGTGAGTGTGAKPSSGPCGGGFILLGALGLVFLARK